MMMRIQTDGLIGIVFTITGDIRCNCTGIRFSIMDDLILHIIITFPSCVDIMHIQ